MKLNTSNYLFYNSSINRLIVVSILKFISPIQTTTSNLADKHSSEYLVSLNRPILFTFLHFDACFYLLEVLQPFLGLVLAGYIINYQKYMPNDNSQIKTTSL